MKPPAVVTPSAGGSLRKCANWSHAADNHVNGFLRKLGLVFLHPQGIVTIRPFVARFYFIGRFIP